MMLPKEEFTVTIDMQQAAVLSQGFYFSVREKSGLQTNILGCRTEFHLEKRYVVVDPAMPAVFIKSVYCSSYLPECFSR